MALVTKTNILIKLREMEQMLGEQGNLYATRDAVLAALQAMIAEIVADGVSNV